MNGWKLEIQLSSQKTTHSLKTTADVFRSMQIVILSQETIVQMV